MKKTILGLLLFGMASGGYAGNPYVRHSAQAASSLRNVELELLKQQLEVVKKEREILALQKEMLAVRAEAKAAETKAAEDVESMAGLLKKSVDEKDSALAAATSSRSALATATAELAKVRKSLADLQVKCEGLEDKLANEKEVLASILKKSAAEKLASESKVSAEKKKVKDLEQKLAAAVAARQSAETSAVKAREEATAREKQVREKVELEKAGEIQRLKDEKTMIEQKLAALQAEHAKLEEKRAVDLQELRSELDRTQKAAAEELAQVREVEARKLAAAQAEAVAAQKALADNEASGKVQAEAREALSLEQRRAQARRDLEEILDAASRKYRERAEALP